MVQLRQNLRERRQKQKIGIMRSYGSGVASPCQDGVDRRKTMHWILDVHFSKAYYHIVNQTIQQNLNMLRKFALNIIQQFKANTNSKRAISKNMFDCLLDPLAICDILEY